MPVSHTLNMLDINKLTDRSFIQKPFQLSEKWRITQHVANTDHLVIILCDLPDLDQFRFTGEIGFSHKM